VEKQIDKLRGFVKQHKLREPSQAMPSGKLRIFADCAGLSSELIALAFLGFTSENMEFVGGSEIDGTKRVLAQAVHKSFGLSTEKKALEHDIFDRNFSNTKASDLYISGFPCPAYSNCGQKLGAKDGQKRGLLVFEGLKYIAYWKPSVVILENVVAFLHKKHARTHEVMRKVFFACGYKVYMKKLSTKEHGIPQSRSRCYFVAFHKSSCRVAFKFPKPRPCPPLVSFLDTDIKGTEKMTLNGYESVYGSSIWQEDIVLDVGASERWQKKMANLCPCLIRSRCFSQGYYLPKQLRRLSSVECGRMQGVPGRLVAAMEAFLVRTETCANEQLAGKHTMAALGDSMSANVLMRIFVRALPAAGLWPSSLTRADRWSSTPKMELGRLADTLYKDIRG
jgi:hypothetical protein